MKQTRSYYSLWQVVQFIGGIAYSLEVVMGLFMDKVSDAVFKSEMLKRLFQEDLRSVNKVEVNNGEAFKSLSEKC